MMTGATHDQLVYVPFSQESPYMSATERIFGDPDGSVTPDYWVIPEPRYPNQIEGEKEILGYDMRYIGVGRELHLSEKTNNDILPMVRKELRGIFHYATADLLRIYPAFGSFTSKWTPETGMSRFDRRRSVLPLDHLQLKAAEPSGKVHEFFNKHTAVHLEKGTRNAGTGRHISRHQLRTHDLEPPFQRGHFLAKAIQFVERARVGGQDEGRESTLHEVLTFHKSLCNSVIAREDDVMAPEHPPRITKRNTASDHDLKYYSYYYPGSPDPIVGFRPFLDQRLALTWKQQGFHLGHLFRSLVMVADDRGSADSVRTKPWYHTAYYCMKTPPGRYKNLRSAEREVERGADHSVSGFRVLLIRTGDENHLSAPISFQPIFEAGKALPLERPDLSTSTLSTDDIVRVRLDDALEFISALIRREEDALPSSVYREADALKDEVTELCEDWIERVLKHASVAGGLEHNVYTRQALGRTRARLNGEAFDTDQLPPDGYISSWQT